MTDYLKDAEHHFLDCQKHLDAAKELYKIDRKEYYNSIILFNCQQSVERALKGFMTLNKMKYDFTHNLEDLRIECNDIDDTFQGIDFKDLTEYAVKGRYETDTTPELHKNHNEIQEYVEIAEATNKLLKKKIQEVLKK